MQSHSFTEANILIIETDDDIQELLVEGVNSYPGFQAQGIKTPSNIDKSIEFLKANKPDAVICQYRMPRMYGLELFSETLKSSELHNTVFIILLARQTLKNDTNFLKQAFLNGLDSYFIMPFDISEMCMFIEGRLKRVRGYLPPNKKVAYNHSFISYSHVNHQEMTEFKQLLNKTGLRVWTDENLEPGTPIWAKSVQEAIENSRSLIVLMSPEAKQSYWVNREIDYAQAFDVRIFPVLIKGDKKTSVPIQLIADQYTDLTLENGRTLSSLIAALKRHIGIVG